MKSNTNVYCTNRIVPELLIKRFYFRITLAMSFIFCHTKVFHLTIRFVVAPNKCTAIYISNHSLIVFYVNISIFVSF